MIQFWKSIEYRLNMFQVFATDMFSQEAVEFHHMFSEIWRSEILCSIGRYWSAYLSTHAFTVNLIWSRNVESWSEKHVCFDMFVITCLWFCLRHPQSWTRSRPELLRGWNSHHHGIMHFYKIDIVPHNTRCPNNYKVPSMVQYSNDSYRCYRVGAPKVSKKFKGNSLPIYSGWEGVCRSSSPTGWGFVLLITSNNQPIIN
jgi:hypothetical protein